MDPLSNLQKAHKNEHLRLHLMLHLKLRLRVHLRLRVSCVCIALFGAPNNTQKCKKSSALKDACHGGINVTFEGTS